MTRSHVKQSPQMVIPDYVQLLWGAFRPLPTVRFKQALAAKIAAGVSRWAAQRDWKTYEPADGDSNLMRHVQAAERTAILCSVLKSEENSILHNIIDGILMGTWSPKQLEHLAKQAATKAEQARGRYDDQDL